MFVGSDVFNRAGEHLKIKIKGPFSYRPFSTMTFQSQMGVHIFMRPTY